MISVLVGGCEPSFLPENWRALLNLQDDLELIGEASSLANTLSVLVAYKPDVLLLDCRLLLSNDLEEIAEIREIQSEVKILLLSGSDFDSEFVTAALRQGARGVLARACSSVDFCKAIRVVYFGDYWIGRKLLGSILHKLLEQAQQSDVMAHLRASTTKREFEIIQYVVQGMTNKEIGKLLGISDKTVKAHLSHIFLKLNLHRRLRISHIGGEFVSPQGPRRT